MTKWVIDYSFAAALFLPDKASSQVNRFFSEYSGSRTLLVPNVVVARSDKRPLYGQTKKDAERG